MKYRGSGATLVAVLACFTGAGCAEPDPDEEPVATTAQAINPVTPGEQHNGKWLLNEVLDLAPYARPTEYFSVLEGGTKNGAAANVKFVGPASLASGTTRGNDSWFTGIILSSGYNIDIRVTAVGGDIAITHYKLESRLTPAGTFNLICEDAIPFKGTFSSSAAHLPTAGRITFGCVDGAVHKCTMFEYPAGTSDTSDMWRAHQACIGMVRAAYCSNGSEHTYNGTLIRFVDRVGVHPLIPEQVGSPIGDWPPDPSVFRFEAAWTGETTRPVDCVGHVRWTSEKVGGLCDEEIPDPRIHADADSCDGLTATDMLADGALIVSAVQANELGLHRWKRTMTAGAADYVVTVQGYHDQTSRYNVPPFALSGIYTYEGTDGFLLRAIPSPAPDNPTVPVSIFHELGAASRFVLARSDSPLFSNNPLYESQPEGYVLENSGNQLAPLELWKNDTTGDYVSTVTAAPTGYTHHIATVGYVRAVMP